MGWRSSHGARRDTNGPVRIEVQPADELVTPNAEDMDARLEEAKQIGRPFKKGNKAGGRKPKLAKLGFDYSSIDVTDPEYTKALRRAEGYRRVRIRELKIAHGFVSVAAQGLISTAALALAVSRYLYFLSAKTGDIDLMKKASSMANDSRQNELAAWELCSREASAKTRLSANATPWLSHEEAKPRIATKSKEPTAEEILNEAEIEAEELAQAKE